MGKILIISQIKIYQSAILYTCELDKINYIRNYYKNIAFEIIKTKENFTSAKTYVTFFKII